MKLRKVIAFLAGYSVSIGIIIVLITLGFGPLASGLIGTIISIALATAAIYLTRLKLSTLTIRRSALFLAISLFGLSALIFLSSIFYDNSTTLGYIGLLLDGAGAMGATLSLEKKSGINDTKGQS